MSIELNSTISALRSMVQSVGAGGSVASDRNIASFATELNQLLNKYESTTATMQVPAASASPVGIPTAASGAIAIPSSASTAATSIENLLANLTAASAVTAAPSSASANASAVSTNATPPWVAPWLAKSGTMPASSLLLKDRATAEAALEAKPGPKEFMDRTGCDFHTATRTLYGVMGSHVDLRDWAKIMASESPLSAARQATAAQFASNLDYHRDAPQKPAPGDVLAKSGPFAWVNRGGVESLWVIDASGNLVTNMKMTPQSIYRASRDFGLDPSHLADLATQIDSNGLLNSKETNGRHLLKQVNLRDIATGGLGSTVDWRNDPYARFRGATAVDQLRADQSLAAELGLRSTG